jgi:hypothetical protein
MQQERSNPQSLCMAFEYNSNMQSSVACGYKGAAFLLLVASLLCCSSSFMHSDSCCLSV